MAVEDTRRSRRGDYDVIVLGAGPAGAAAALALAKKGFSVAALDRTRGSVRRFGETLPPTVVRPLMRLGVWESFLRAGHAETPGTVAIWGDGRPRENDFAFNPYGNGWHIDRLGFDAMLVAEARAAGATVRFEVSPIDCVHHARGRWILRFAGSGEFSLTARWVIDATGRSAWFARLQQVARRPIDRLVALIGLGRASPTADPRTFIEADLAGWWYAAVLPKDRAVTAFFTDADLVPRDSRRRADWWNQLLHNTQFVSTLMLPTASSPVLRTAPADSASLMRCAGRDWLAIGDAAQSYDPLSGQGITKALSTALATAEAISICNERDSSDFEDFADLADVEFHKYLTVRLMHYRGENRWPDSLFWSRRHALG